LSHPSKATHHPQNAAPQQETSMKRFYFLSVAALILGISTMLSLEADAQSKGVKSSSVKKSPGVVGGSKHGPIITDPIKKKTPVDPPKRQPTDPKKPTDPSAGGGTGGQAKAGDTTATGGKGGDATGKGTTGGKGGDAIAVSGDNNTIING